MLETCLTESQQQFNDQYLRFTLDSSTDAQGVMEIADISTVKLTDKMMKIKPMENKNRG